MSLHTEDLYNLPLPFLPRSRAWPASFTRLLRCCIIIQVFILVIFVIYLSLINIFCSFLTHRSWPGLAWPYAYIFIYKPQKIYIIYIYIYTHINIQAIFSSFFVSWNSWKVLPFSWSFPMFLICIVLLYKFCNICGTGVLRGEGGRGVKRVGGRNGDLFGYGGICWLVGGRFWFGGRGRGAG